MGSPRETWRDERRVHVLTRGNVDGITSAALALARYPDARVSFVTNAGLASQAMRRDLSSRTFLLIDLGLTPPLAKTLGRKAAAGAQVVLLDHHDQTLRNEALLDPAVARLIVPGISAAAVTRRWLGLERLTHLSAIADVVEYCASDDLERVRVEVGDRRLHREAEMLDFAWRFDVPDDRFRTQVARRLADGAWPSEIPEVRRRYFAILNERRWERALERVRARIQVTGNVALLSFPRRKPSLFGFGSRAVAAVARERGCRVALLVHRRADIVSVSARLLAPCPEVPERIRPELDLGRFLHEFTAYHGGSGGGHPESAGGKIPHRALGTFLKEIEVFA
ncbi:MAG: hypothetical protein KY455_08380 [Euryarchaeota archaeon]|nr:hypothetical protein [Euryarchaeota archaeon]